LATARTEAEDDRAPLPRGRFQQQSPDVVRANAALEAVQDEQERASVSAMRTGRSRLRPVEVDEITVGGGHALSPQRQIPPAEERAPDRLQVPIPAPPRGPVRYACPCSRSFATSDAIPRARSSSCASVRFAMGCGIARNL